MIDPSDQYREQITGLIADGDTAPVWAQIIKSTGQHVYYDGHTYRGPEKLEVFLQSQYDYSALAFVPNNPYSEFTSRQFLRQATMQLQALPEGAVLEWHMEDPHAGAAVKDMFERARFDNLEVVYTPAVTDAK